MSPKPIADLRREYTLAGLDERDLAPDPVAQFSRWFDAAREAGVYEPNAMILSTIGADGPNARTVLLKDFSEKGFTFFTGYESAKGRELAEDPRASLVFLWHALERQIRIRGRVEKVPREVSEAYFATRPRGSQLGAWASSQSEPIGSRAELEKRLRDMERRWEGKDIPAPPAWGGYLLCHESVEFWQGRPNRLHDRIVYLLEPSKDVAQAASDNPPRTTATSRSWALRRLMP